jgi:hypothetical protein
MKKFVPFILLAMLFSSVGAFAQKKNETHIMPDSRPGFFNITEISGGIGIYQVNRDYAKSLLNLTTIGGFGLSKHLTAGVGIGFAFYNGGNLQPLFADLRYFFKLGKTRLFVSADGGILLNSGKTETGRKYIVSPGAGVLLPLTDNLGLNIGASLYTQLMEGMDHDSFINAKAGITFLFNKTKK